MLAPQTDVFELPDHLGPAYIPVARTLRATLNALRATIGLGSDGVGPTHQTRCPDYNAAARSEDTICYHFRD